MCVCMCVVCVVGVPVCECVLGVKMEAENIHYVWKRGE